MFFVVVVVAARAAAADSLTSLTIDSATLETELESLTPQLDEPIGLVAIAKKPKLGLEKGDVVRAIDGESPWNGFSMLGRSYVHLRNGTVVFLDVVRGGKRLTIRLAVKVAPVDHTVKRLDYQHAVDELKADAARSMSQVTRDGKPSGVVMTRGWGWRPGEVGDGDIIRSVDGAMVTTIDEAVAALDKARDHDRVVLKLDRVDQPVTVTYVLVDASKEELDAEKAQTEIDALVPKIKKVNDTTYELPKRLVDLVLANPMVFAKGARVVPSIKDGKPHGFKLYAIRPNSAIAALGLTNGDTIVAINGFDMTSADKALEVYTKLRDATALQVDIERRGQRLTLSWTVK